MMHFMSIIFRLLHSSWLLGCCSSMVYSSASWEGLLTSWILTVVTNTVWGRWTLHVFAYKVLDMFGGCNLQCWKLILCLYSIYICICVYIFSGGIEMIGLGNFVYIHALIAELILGRLLFLFVTGLVNQLTKPRK